MGTVENQQAQDIDDDWVRERKKEFEEVIDANHDMIVTMEELEVGPLLSVLLKDNNTFIASIWMYICPLLIFLLSPQEYMDPMNEYNALNEWSQADDCCGRWEPKPQPETRGDP